MAGSLLFRHSSGAKWGECIIGGEHRAQKPIGSSCVAAEKRVELRYENIRWCFCPGNVGNGFRMRKSKSGVLYRDDLSATRLKAINSSQSETVSTKTTVSEVKEFKSSTTNGALTESLSEPKRVLSVDNEKSAESSLFESVPPGGIALTFACLVGLLAGGGVVLFNDTVHLIHDSVWTGVPESGATWIRTQPLESTWKELLFIPISGGVVVGGLNAIRSGLEVKAGLGKPDSDDTFSRFLNGLRSTTVPFLKALSAAVTLGTGNSLGPEGPSVEIGSSVATGIGNLLKNSRERMTSMVAAGSAAGISSGFNAAVSGCFFAVENVLRSASFSSDSLTTAMILLASVLASVVSQAGLGSDPAFRVPAYEFKSPAELPLYLLLGVLCGGVSIALVRGSAYASKGFELLQKKANIPTILLPSIGGLCTGVIALFYPEVLYWGFENVNELLESRPLVYAPPTSLLFQLVGAKIVATALCRGSGLVGGVYAPSLFIGAALGSAYGRFIVYVLTVGGPATPIAWISVAAPQAYALVSMAAVLAGVCQVPLTSVLLLFELTRDYRIILPLMATVGVSSWIASTATKKPAKPQNKIPSNQPPSSPSISTTPPNPESTTATPVTNENEALSSALSSKAILLDAGEEAKLQNPVRVAEVTVPRSENINVFTAMSSDPSPVSLIDDSLYVLYGEGAERQMMSEITVQNAMRDHYAFVRETSVVKDALEEMTEKQEWCCLVLGKDDELKGLVTLVDIQEEIQQVMRSTSSTHVNEIIQSLPVTSINGAMGDDLVTIFPHKNLKTADRLMTPRGLRQLPVIQTKQSAGEEPIPIVIGLLDREAIRLACRVELTRRLLGTTSPATTT